MTLTTRSGKGSALTHAEMDANWSHLGDSSNSSYTPSGSGAVVRTVQEKLREGEVSITDYGAVPDTGADQSAAIQRAFAASNRVYAPAGTFKCIKLQYVPGLMLRGAGRSLTVFQHTGDATGAILYSGAVDATGQEAIDFHCQDMTFDGNVSGASVNAGQALLHAYQARRFHCERVDFINGNGYGCGLEGTPTDSNVYKRGPAFDVSFYDCRFMNNGWNIDGSSNSADGVDIKWSIRTVFVRCHAERNSDKGFNPRGRHVTLIGCTAVNNSTGIAPGMIDPITTTTTLDGDITAAATSIALTSAAHLPLVGIVIIDSERIFYDGISGNSITGCLRSYGSAAAASHSSGATVSNDDTDGHINIVSCFAEGNTNNGIGAVANGTASNAYITVSACQSRNNGGSGFGVIAASSTGVNTVIFDNCISRGNALHGLSAVTVSSLRVNGGNYDGNTTDGIRLDTQAGAKIRASARNNGGSGIRLLNTCSGIDCAGSVVTGNSGAALSAPSDIGFANTGYVEGALGTVTAAATLTLKHQRPKMQINGNTSITSITATFDGDYVILHFTGTPTLTKGNNLKMAADFVATADDIVALVCNGTNWYQISGSANA